jgi:hypothetical protein
MQVGPTTQWNIHEKCEGTPTSNATQGNITIYNNTKEQQKKGKKKREINATRKNANQNYGGFTCLGHCFPMLLTSSSLN